MSPEARRLTDERATLVGSGVDSCTNGAEAGNVWCAFYKSSATIGKYELWVIDIDGALADLAGRPAGALVSCNGAGDAHCFKLSSDLHSAMDSSFVSGFSYTGFLGRTLLLYENALSGEGERFMGDVLAWRPGWSKPHRLSTPGKGYRCSVTRSGGFGLCIDNVDTSISGKTSFEYLAGPLSDGGTTLPVQDTIECCEDVEGSQKFSAAFTPDENYFVWSGRATIASPYVFHYKSTADLGTQDQETLWPVANIGRVIVLPGSDRYLSFRDYTFTPGDLVLATFPPVPAETPTTIDTQVGTVSVLADSTYSTWYGLHYLRSAGSTTWDWWITRTPADPAAGRKLVAPSICRPMEIDSGFHHAVYAETCAMPEDGGLARLEAVTLDDAGNVLGTPCALSAGTTASTFGLRSMTDSGRWFYWADNVDTSIGVGDAKLTDLDACTTAPVGVSAPLNHAVWTWYPIGDAGFIDNTDSDGIRATIRTVDLRGGSVPSAPALVQSNAGIWFSVPTPALNRIVYTVAQNNTKADGLWIWREDGAGLFLP